MGFYYERSAVKYNKVDISELLKSSICKVTFEKIDGTLREMKCTLMENAIETYERITDRTKPANDSVVSVWDIDKQSWRSFRIDSVKIIEVLE